MWLGALLPDPMGGLLQASVPCRNYAVYHSTHRPELYLYSRDDHLCDVKELEPLLAIRESR